jgi:hypothetical protein
VAKGAVAVSYPSIAGGEVWWQERRPAEGGRTAIAASAGPGASPRDLLPQPWNARTRVHEYGGKSYLAVPSLSQSSPGGATPRTPRCPGGRARWQKPPSYRAAALRQLPVRENAGQLGARMHYASRHRGNSRRAFAVVSARQVSPSGCRAVSREATCAATAGAGVQQ